MAKLNINFNNTNYEIDESVVAEATTALQVHLSTTMAGSGATINLGGVAYNIDSTKLSTATNNFVSHLGTISGNGSKVKVNGVEYSIGSDKVSDALGELEAVFGGLNNPTEPELAAGLYRDGVMLKSWDELLNDGSITVENSIITQADEDFCYLQGEVLIIADGITEIGDDAFYAKGASITYIPDSVTTIGRWAFEDTTGRTGIIFGENSHLTTIGQSAFASLYELTSLTLPAGVTSIGNYAFESGDTLVELNFLGTVEQWRAIKFAENWNSDLGATYVQCSDGKVCVEHIFEDGHCINCDAAQPAGLYVDGVMTKSWDSLISEEIITVEDNVITGSNTEALVGDLVIAEGITKIDNRAFSGCSPLTSVEIPASVTALGFYIFEDCTNLKNVTFGEGWQLNTLSNGIFYQCTSLESIEIPTSVTSIQQYAFRGCAALTSIEIPTSVTSIQQYAFSGCAALTSVKIPSSVTSISNHVFANCSSLTSAELSTSMPGYNSSTFENCTALTSVSFGEGGRLSQLHDKMFKNCTNLESIEIPESVTMIGSNIFEGCSSLTSIEIPESVHSCGLSVFKDCINLENIKIPEKTSSIGNYFFYNCTALTSIEIPAGVTTIGISAFSNCGSLGDIIFKGSMAQWNNVTKKSNWNLNVPATYVQCSDGQVAL